MQTKTNRITKAKDRLVHADRLPDMLLQAAIKSNAKLQGCGLNIPFQDVIRDQAVGIVMRESKGQIDAASVTQYMSDPNRYAQLSAQMNSTGASQEEFREWTLLFESALQVLCNQMISEVTAMARQKGLL